MVESSCSWSAGSETQCLSPYIIQSVLWSCVYDCRTDHTLDSNVLELQHWPPVLYHPYHVPVVFGSTASTLAINGRNVVVSPRKSDSYFEICVTSPTLCMTSALWETVLSTLRSTDGFEHLRELGGSIEPLTWEEGQGQGVIVRLPWANA
jgi:hypothetical protein